MHSSSQYICRILSFINTELNQLESALNFIEPSLGSYMYVIDGHNQRSKYEYHYEIKSQSVETSEHSVIQCYVRCGLTLPTRGLTCSYQGTVNAKKL